jgi:hypothetical protein
MMREAMPSDDPGGVRAMLRGELSERGEVARGVPSQQARLVGLPESLGGRGQLVAGLTGRIEHDRPGGDGRLQVGLVEGREDTLRAVQPGVHRQIGLAVGGVGEAMHARAGARVGHVGLDPQFVVGLQSR